jgi:uncharacterized protein (DUF3084 family)
MVIKHKVIKDFQYLSTDKKIFVLKSGTILENYKYSINNETIDIDKDIVDSNPDFFESINWKYELLSYLKTNKIPQPSQLSKKLIPFIEDMILSSIAKLENSTNIIDESKIKDLENKEKELKNREKIISEKEEEIDIRLKIIEKREESCKEDLKEIDKKEDALRERLKELNEKQLEIEDKLQNINEKERNLDRILLESSKDIDAKYIELQKKIDKDLKYVSEREKDLEILSKQIKKRQEKLNQLESELDNKSKNLEIRIEEIKKWENDLKRLDAEIKNWESMHWKLKRMSPPPSAIIK